jgi:hypothetical protein
MELLNYFFTQSVLPVRRSTAQVIPVGVSAGKYPAQDSEGPLGTTVTKPAEGM